LLLRLEPDLSDCLHLLESVDLLEICHSESSCIPELLDFCLLLVDDGLLFGESLLDLLMLEGELAFVHLLFGLLLGLLKGLGELCLDGLAGFPHKVLIVQELNRLRGLKFLRNGRDIDLELLLWLLKLFALLGFGGYVDDQVVGDLLRLSLELGHGLFNL